MSGTLLLRGAVVIAAVGAAVWLLSARADASRCKDAREQIFAQSFAGGVDGQRVDAVLEDCDDPEQLALAAVGVARVDRTAAQRLARAATDMAPDAFAGWAATTVAWNGEDQRRARAAWQRAKELNPRWGALRPSADP